MSASTHNFTKILLLVFIPQQLKYVLSTPQLFGLSAAPRAPVKADEGLLHQSVAVLKGPPSLIITLLAKLRLTWLAHVPTSNPNTSAHKKGAKGVKPALGAHTTITKPTLLNGSYCTSGPCPFRSQEVSCGS